ncbi:hypothetical protein HBE99_02545 [Mycobacteroides chelonae]|uniref:hypothetical protein n=1 Tax=Mycobacteroides chelonae TaxID=1774 RepID=UPI001910505E|nr:hypothetical protein [Mycobacteroides chelonae]QQG95882.1 hypothetical protein HBE99_02545 [Mycobacteroides chelonae]
MKKKYSVPIAALAAAVTLTACSTECKPVSAVTAAANEAIESAVRFGATGIDRDAARTALEDGRLYLVSLGGADACPAAVLAPTFSQAWLVNNKLTAKGTGMTLSYTPSGCDTASPTWDTAELAERDRRPFIAAVPDGANPVCNVAVTAANGVTWYLNRSGGPSPRGDALDRMQKQYGCTAGEVVPGVPTSVNPK